MAWPANPPPFHGVKNGAEVQRAAGWAAFACNCKAHPCSLSLSRKGIHSFLHHHSFIHYFPALSEHDCRVTDLHHCPPPNLQAPPPLPQAHFFSFPGKPKTSWRGGEVTWLSQHPIKLTPALSPIPLPPHQLEKAGGRKGKKIFFSCMLEKEKIKLKNMYTTPSPKRLTIIFTEGGEWGERVQTSLSPVLIGNVSTVYVTKSVRVISYRRADFSLDA